MSVVAILALLAVVLVIALIVQRAMKKGEGSSTGGDIVAYLILALSMSVTGFALAELAETAFPGDQFVFDPAQSLATSLAALAVSVPFLLFFWRRQADRRVSYPHSPGWTLYLSLMQLVFLTAFAVAAVMFVNGLITDARASAWTGTVVFGVIVVFHEVVARRTPPGSDGQDLPRTIGSAIGLITATIGVSATLAALFDLVFDMSTSDFEPFVAMIIVGLPIWLYQWVRSRRADNGVPWLTWLVIVTTGSLLATLATATTLSILTLQYLLAKTADAALHFHLAPVLLAVFLTGLTVWLIHRRAMGPARDNAKRMYEYVVAGAGLASAVASAVGLTYIALDTNLLVGGGTSNVTAFAVPLIVGLFVWRYFDSRPEQADPEEEVAAWPRRLYHLGLGIVFALVGAGALITALFVLLRSVLDDTGDGAPLLEPTAIFVYAGLAAWYLLSGHARDRAAIGDDEVATPFDVTILCSHPGPISVKFPKEARLRVIYRGDDLGVIDEEMADTIVSEVAHRSSLVWVDGDGFRIAPLRGKD